MLTQFKESVAYIQSKTNVQPTVGIILGTGLGERNRNH
jgi:purine nucleoside phosphorylase